MSLLHIRSTIDLQQEPLFNTWSVGQKLPSLHHSPCTLASFRELFQFLTLFLPNVKLSVVKLTHHESIFPCHSHSGWKAYSTSLLFTCYSEFVFQCAWSWVGPKSIVIHSCSILHWITQLPAKALQCSTIGYGASFQCVHLLEKNCISLDTGWL